MSYHLYKCLSYSLFHLTYKIVPYIYLFLYTYFLPTSHPNSIIILVFHWDPSQERRENLCRTQIKFWLAVSILLSHMSYHLYKCLSYSLFHLTYKIVPYIYLFLTDLSSKFDYYTCLFLRSQPRKKRKFM